MLPLSGRTTYELSTVVVYLRQAEQNAVHVVWEGYPYVAEHFPDVPHATDWA